MLILYMHSSKQNMKQTTLLEYVAYLKCEYILKNYIESTIWGPNSADRGGNSQYNIFMESYFNIYRLG